MNWICPIFAAMLLVADAAAADLNLLDLIGGETQGASVAKAGRNRKRRPIKVEREDEFEDAADEQDEGEVRIVTNVVEKPIVVERVVTNVVEKPVVVEHVVTNEVAVVPVVGATNVLANAVSNALPAAKAELKKPRAPSRPATITSRSTYYDRKEGFAVFSGRVHVDDEQYQMHADKAYVFFEGTNQLKRIVATGGVALTNGTRRAYGGKASYYRKSGMVVLYSGENAPAEVRDDAKDKNQVVKGSKIKFWIDAEQVEVLDAHITAPATGGIGDLKLK